MELLFTYLEAFGCLDCILFDFSLARGLDYYTGLIYEAVLTDENKVGSIAGGGRYDGLVGMFSGKDIPAVGVSIGIERVFAILEEKANNKNVRATKTEIFVAQIGKSLTPERMKILGELWNAGIKAETLYSDNPKVPKQIEYALNTGIPLILWIGEDEIAKGVIKIKSLSYHEEVFVDRKNMIEEVKKLIVKNPVLLTEEEQKEFAASDPNKEEKKVSIKVDASKESSKPFISKRNDCTTPFPKGLDNEDHFRKLNELEKQLTSTVYMNGDKPTSLDRDALQTVGETPPSAEQWPHTFAWWVLASKYSETIRNSWPEA